MRNIEVNIKLFPELFSNKTRIIIPEYQRPYVWGKDKTEELLEDFKEFFLDTHTTKPYYLGTVLFFYDRRNATYEIIDGQQRITTLLILQQTLNNSLPENRNVEFSSHQSIKYIKEAQTYFKRNIELLEKLNEVNFLDRLNFTLIVTHSEDDAFTFFDTQNNRGIKLSASDFLKAYHLRAIASEYLQEDCAIDWETESAKNVEGPFLNFLFDKILWRSRNWKGQYQIYFENKDFILQTFQKNSLKSEQVDGYPLYSSFFNRKSLNQSWQQDGTSVSVPTFENGNAVTQLPFTLRQPIYKGINFFKYTAKYSAIFDLLFISSTSEEIEVKQAKEFYNSVYTHDMSIYLRQFMQLCLVAYYDSFGKQNLLDAALCFDYLFGALRLERQQVKREAAPKCLKQNNNLLDVIANAYLPNEIFDFVYKGNLKFDKKSCEEIYAEEEVETGMGVRGRYKQRVLNYFNKSNESLNNRKKWSKF